MTRVQVLSDDSHPPDKGRAAVTCPGGIGPSHWHNLPVWSVELMLRLLVSDLQAHWQLVTCRLCLLLPGWQPRATDGRFQGVPGPDGGIRALKIGQLRVSTQVRDEGKIHIESDSGIVRHVTEHGSTQSGMSPSLIQIRDQVRLRTRKKTNSKFIGVVSRDSARPALRLAAAVAAAA